MKLYSSEIACAVRNHLDNHGIHYEWDGENGIARFHMTLRGNLHTTLCILAVLEDAITGFAVCPLSADPRNPKQMMAMTEFLTRANYNLIHGNFEMDYRDGEIRFRNTIHCGEVCPSDEMIRNAIGFPINMISRYGGGIISILFHKQTPREAIKQCEEARTAPMDTLLAQLHRSPHQFLNDLSSFLTEEMRRYEE